ncbi:hypothetical protein GGX14DRAFT_563751 [Mycena pura]|uniref:Uncharacterized protein n=1 Tax=Mycena pura TaxID=153505 RepID=A0AAD6VHT6_9AGAR|nr:hypothetical protein GGX14DRAFT_563751 [Mycena pura]
MAALITTLDYQSVIGTTTSMSIAKDTHMHQTSRPVATLTRLVAEDACTVTVRVGTTSESSVINHTAAARVHAPRTRAAAAAYEELFARLGFAELHLTTTTWMTRTPRAGPRVRAAVQWDPRHHWRDMPAPDAVAVILRDMYGAATATVRIGKLKAGCATDHAMIHAIALLHAI